MDSEKELSVKPSYFLRTERLGFRSWHKDDLELAIGLWGDLEVTRLFDARGRWSNEEVKARLVSEMNTYERYGVQYWPIFHIENGLHVGCCGLRPYDPPIGGKASPQKRLKP